MADLDGASVRTVVCLHSLFLSPDMFSELTAHGGPALRFIAPAFPGQVDRVNDPTATVTMDACADDILAQVGRLGVERFSMVAQSMGADVGVRIAARQPERVERMVLMGASVRAEPEEQRRQFEGLSAEIERHGFTPEIVEIVMGVLLGASTLADSAKAPLRDAVRAQLAAIPRNLVHAARGVVEREDATPLLPQVAAKVLIVSGSEDQVRPPLWSDEMFDAIPDCELWRIKRAGHSPILEAPERVMPRVIEFLTAS